jgi:hypothetical protein
MGGWEGVWRRREHILACGCVTKITRDSKFSAHSETEEFLITSHQLSAPNARVRR